MMKKYLLIFSLLVVIIPAFAQLPETQWARSFVENNFWNYSVYSNGRSVAVDNAGNVYSTGLFTNETDFDPGPAIYSLDAANWAHSAIYVSKLSPTGDFMWAIQIPTYVEFGNIEITVDKDNNVYVASELRLPTDFDPGPGVVMLSPTGGWDAFVAKYDTNGNLVWAKQFGGPGDTVPRSDVLAVDDDNNVVVCGNFNNTVDFDPGPGVYNITSSAHIQSFVVKLNTNGDFVWAKQFGNSPIVYLGSNIADVKCDHQGNIYMTGNFTGSCDFDPGAGTFLLASTSMRDGYIAKLDADGNFGWAKRIGNTTNDYWQYAETRGIALDADNNVYTGGDFFGSFDFDPGPGSYIINSAGSSDCYVLKLNAQGDFVWAGAFGGINQDVGTVVAAGADGNIYASGYILHTADMDPGPAVHTLTSANMYEATVILKLNPNGGYISAGSFENISTYGELFARRIVSDQLNNIYLTGYVAGIVDMDMGPGVYPLNSGGTQAPFVAKLSKCLNATASTLNISACSSYTLNGETFTTAGTYIRTIPNSFNCDSVITLHLTLNNRYTDQNKMICEGESFFAGGAYQTTTGIYKDTLLSSLNCDSVVTTHLTVNPKPLPNLGADRSICTGTSAIISPGTFAQYLWQDMSRGNNYTVNAAGLYWVKVTDGFNCSATDSVVIVSLLPSPSGFLKDADSICTYEKIQLSALTNFNQYLWSTGATEKQIKVDMPGQYRLTVTDVNGCRGADSITVYAKNCAVGVYLPGAFTPNNDGKNDLFKATVFGKLQSFKLQVFDKMGNLVYYTNDPSQGWDGRFRGQPFSTAAFVWQCAYQLENKMPVLDKGSVILLR